MQAKALPHSTCACGPDAISRLANEYDKTTFLARVTPQLESSERAEVEALDWESDGTVGPSCVLGQLQRRPRLARAAAALAVDSGLGTCAAIVADRAARVSLQAGPIAADSAAAYMQPQPSSTSYTNALRSSVRRRLSHACRTRGIARAECEQKLADHLRAAPRTQDVALVSRIQALLKAAALENREYALALEELARLDAARRRQQYEAELLRELLGGDADSARAALARHGSALQFLRRATRLPHAALEVLPHSVQHHQLLLPSMAADS